MYLLKCFWDTFASFIGYYEVAQDTRTKVVPSKKSHNVIESNLKMAGSNPIACLHLSLSQLSILGDNTKRIFIFVVNITLRN